MRGEGGSSNSTATAQHRMHTRNCTLSTKASVSSFQGRGWIQAAERSHHARGRQGRLGQERACPAARKAPGPLHTPQSTGPDLDSADTREGTGDFREGDHSPQPLTLLLQEPIGQFLVAGADHGFPMLPEPVGDTAGQGA